MFRSDTKELRKWVDVRRKELEDARSPYESLWEDLRRNYEPAIGHALKGDLDTSRDAASRDDEEIFNSTPRINAHRLSAGLQSGITNQARQWFRFQAAGQRLGTNATRSYLDGATEEVQRQINRSNIYPTLDQIYLRLGVFGQACALLVPDGTDGVRMILCDEGAYYIADNNKGRVDTLMRRINMSYAQIVDEFGREDTPDYILDRLDKGGREQRATIYNLVCPVDAIPEGKLKDIPADREFASLYWVGGVNSGVPSRSDELKNSGFVAIRSFTYNPIIAPRWSPRCGSAYGFGPGEEGLGDARELQQLELAKMKLVEGESDPPMLAPASMRGDPIDTGPGGITYYNEAPQSTGTTRPVQRLFETRNSIEAVQQAIITCEERLRQIFLLDLFALMMNLNLAPKTMTAREVTELSSEKVALLGPILTRLNNDLLNPLVDGIWAVMVFQEQSGNADFGLLNAPSELMGEEIDAEYVSTLHAEQQASSRLTGLYRILEFAQGLAQFDASTTAKLNTFKMLDVAASSFFELGCVRDDKEAQAIIQQAQQAQQSEQRLKEAQAAEAEAKGIKALAQAPAGNGNVLDMIAGEGYGQ